MRTAIICGLVLAASLSVTAQTTTMSGRLQVSAQLSYAKTNAGVVVSATIPSGLVDWSFANGTNAAEMTACYVEAPATLTNSAAVEYSLLALTNCFGDAIQFSRVNWFAVRAGPSNAAPLTLDAVTNAVAFSSGDVEIQPSGIFFVTAPSAEGYSVATNAHLVSLSNSSTNDLLYGLWIGGVAE